MSGLIDTPAALDNWLWLLRAAALMTAMLFLGMALRHWRRSQERDAQRMFEQLDLLRTELLLLQERIEQTPAAATPIAQSTPLPVVNVERSIPMPTAMPMMPAPRGYEVAARLARSGATVDELMSSCGLSRHEAQLVQRLHGQAEKTEVVAPRPAPAATASSASRQPARAAAPSVTKSAVPTRRVEPRLGDRVNERVNERVPERPVVRPTSRLATAV